MISTSKAGLLLLVLASFGCGLERPAKIPPFDCARIDRAEERFPDLCGADSGVDASEGEDP